MGGCLSNERKGTPVVERKGTPVVLKMKLDCSRCESEVKEALKGFPGVEAVDTDSKNKVTVWGNADPCKIMKRIKEKTGKDVEIVSPANPPEKQVRIKEKTEKVVEIVSPANPPKKHVRIKEKAGKDVEIVSPANPPKKHVRIKEKTGKDVEIVSPANPPEKHVRIKEKTEKDVEIVSPANPPKKHVRIKEKTGKDVEIVSPAHPRKNSSNSSKSIDAIIIIEKCYVYINSDNNKNDGEVGNDRKTGAYFSKDKDTKKPKKIIREIIREVGCRDDNVSYSLELFPIASFD